MMYYVYEWYIVDTDEIIYVGKGTRNRYKVRKHNSIFNEFIRRFKCDSRIIKSFESESEAFQYEFERINELRHIGQCVCNIYNGGFGGSTDWWTDELRKRYSENNIMKSESQRKRMSENNPMKIKEIAEKSGISKRRAVIINGIEYESVGAAVKSLNVSYDTLKKWCQIGVNDKLQPCRYKDTEQVDFTGSCYYKFRHKPILYKGERYESVKECASIIGVQECTIIKWAKKGFDAQGNSCRYEGDTNDYKYVYPFKGRTKSKAVILNGVRYDSVQDAAKAIGKAPTTIYSYIQGVVKDNKYICSYDNQQPSQTNSNNSSLEGSTTNE